MAPATHICLIVCLLFSCASVSAQDSTRSRITILEVGTEIFDIEPTGKDYIRDDLSASGFLNYGIKGTLTTVFAGAKIEQRTRNDKFGISAGVRYTFLHSSIYKNSLFPNFFYVLHRESPTTREYLSIIELAERSHYLGIPVELRMYTSAQRRWRWYVTAGGEWMYRMATSLRVVFNDADMKIFEKDIETIVGKSDPWYAWIYFGGGLRFGSDRERWSAGINVPIVVSQKMSSLHEPRPAVGFHVQYILCCQ